jgi:hypothetical protein
MKATQTLPENYVLYREIDLSRDYRLLVVLNLVGLALLALSGWLYWRLALIIRPDIHDHVFQVSSLGSILAILLAIVGVIIFHELIHGLFFWLITTQRPYFGFRGAYAFAAAPTWFIARNAYLLVGLSPLILITFFGLLLLPLIPLAGLLPLLYALTANTAGAIGDVAIVAWLLAQPASIMIRDRGDAVAVYTQENP